MSSYNPYLSESALHEAYLAVRRAQPDMGLAEISALLRVTEEELLLESGAQVFALGDDWPRLLGTLPSLGVITFLTGNRLVRLAQAGVVERVICSPGQVRISGPGLDILADISHWRQAYYVQGCLEGRYPHGIYCMDRQGRCCHRLLLREEAPCRQVGFNTQHATSSGLAENGAIRRIPALNDPCRSARQRRDFIADWSVMQGPRDYWVLLLEHGLSERQAVQEVAPVYAHGVDGSAIRAVLQAAAETALPLQLSCPGLHLVQRYAGLVPPWCGLQLPPRPSLTTLCLNLAEQEPLEAWVVRRPHASGIRTTLDIFDRQGELALRLGDASDSSHAECEEWRELLEDIPVVSSKLGYKSSPDSRRH